MQSASIRAGRATHQENCGDQLPRDSTASEYQGYRRLCLTVCFLNPESSVISKWNIQSSDKATTIIYLVIYPPRHICLGHSYTTELNGNRHRRHRKDMKHCFISVDGLYLFKEAARYAAEFAQLLLRLNEIVVRLRCRNTPYACGFAHCPEDTVGSHSSTKRHDQSGRSRIVKWPNNF